MHRHGIEQFIGKMNSSRRLKCIDCSAPLDFVPKFRERQRLSILQDRKRLNDSVPQSREKIRPTSAYRLKNVVRKVTMMRALLDNNEVVDLAELLPYFRELSGQQLAEKGADAHVREIIAAPP